MMMMMVIVIDLPLLPLHLIFIIIINVIVIIIIIFTMSLYARRHIGNCCNIDVCAKCSQDSSTVYWSPMETTW